MMGGFIGREGGALCFKVSWSVHPVTISPCLCNNIHCLYNWMRKGRHNMGNS